MSATNRGSERLPLDAYYTPAWCTKRALENIPLPFGRGVTWLEPCAGDRSISYLISQSLSGTGTQLEEDDIAWGEGGNFFEKRGLAGVYGSAYDVIFTNPPYSIANQFLSHALGLARNVVFLMRLNYLAGHKRAEFMRDFTPDVYVLPERPSFTGDGKTDATEYAWMHWKQDSKPGQGGRIFILPSTPKAERGV